MSQWECFHNCGRTVSDEFYEKMLREAKHPPLCVCRHSFNGWNKQPWSLWRKIEVTNNN